MSALSDLEDQVVAMCIDAQLRAWTPDELEQVRQRASTYLRMRDQGGEDAASGSALFDATADARKRLRYALKREPLPIERGRRHA